MTFVRGKSKMCKSCATVVWGRLVLFLPLRWKNSEIVREMQLWRKNLIADEFFNEYLRFMKTELPIETTRPRAWHLISTITCSLETNKELNYLF
jgi:hypothetical protein